MEMLVVVLVGLLLFYVYGLIIIFLINLFKTEKLPYSIKNALLAALAIVLIRQVLDR
jgi:uncharacterized protein with PQ loop repeat